MAEGERPGSKIRDNKTNPIIQTLNIILQKVIQVNKPTEYYENREKIKTFIY